uniref:Uncharacterized protein n=1 Tax=Knipowitschia caucasica TaxID=637954 RepID=A0AAV2K4J5_KNICA
MERLILTHLRSVVSPTLDPLQFAYRPNIGGSAVTSSSHIRPQVEFRKWQTIGAHALALLPWCFRVYWGNPIIFHPVRREGKEINQSRCLYMTRPD